MPLHIRRAALADLPFLFNLECVLFAPTRRESRRSIRRSVVSPHQEVWLLLDELNQSIGSITLRNHPHLTRIYSLGVLPEAQGKGGGRTLLDWGESRAIDRKALRMSLEVDASDERLVDFYHRRGFGRDEFLSDYYGPADSGIRMFKDLSPSELSS